MSWEEYKAKREGKPQTISTTNSTTTSSWEEYKKKREKAREEEEERRRVEQEKQKNESAPIAENGYTSKNKSFLDKLSYIGKNLKSGILSGTAGIAQSGLTDAANQMEKGSQNNIWNILGDSANALIGLVNPMQGINNTISKIPERASNTLNTLTDKNKNAVEKIVSIGLDATNAPIEDNKYKNLFDVGNQVVGKISPNVSNEILNINNKISEPLQQKQQEILEEAKEYGKTTQTLGEVAQVIGNMVPSIAATALTRNPNAGLATMAMSAKGQSTQEALNKGVELDEAVKIGNTKAMIEVGTEMLTGGVNIFGKGALDDIVQRGIVDKVKNKIAKTLVQQGVNISGEILEETISDVLDTTIDKGTIDPNASYSINDWEDTALTTMLSTVVLNALTGGLGITQNLKDNNTDLQQNQSNNENNLRTEEITNPTVNNVNQNTQALQQQNIAPIENIIEQNNTILPKARDSFLETAKQYNIDTNNETIQSINRIMNERGINASFNSELFTDNSQNAIWKISKDENGEVTREVVLNPNSDSKKTLQNIVTHELTHDLEGTAEHNELRDLILKYDKKQINYEDARKSLENIYSKVYDPNSSDFQTLVENEAVADILGNKLGDQEFINNLTMKKPSLGRKIYNWVVDKLNKLTGYSNEKLFWQDVKNKFENAYRQDYQNNNNDIKYSKEVLSDGTKYIKLDNKLFQNQDGTLKTAREAYNTLVGKTLILDDGTEVKILKSLPKKDLYNELSKRRPRSKNVENISEMNNKINGNLDESIESSLLINTRPDVNSRHIEQGIKNFDTREVYLFDGTGAYRLTLSIAELQSGEKVAYSKKNLTYDKQLTEKIKNELSSSSTSNNGRSSRMITPNNSIASSNENVNTIKYSIQESENNSGSFSMQDNKGRILTKEQQEYFKDVSQKLRDENGNIKEYYHGTQRADRVGNYFDPNKATSGPMAFFTDNSDIAKSYSENKQDTSISREADTEYDLFKSNGKDLDTYWNSLTKQQQEEINKKGRAIGFDEDYENIVYDENHDSFSGQYDYYLKNEEHNNGIKALYDVFIQDGNLFGEDMAKFKDVLALAGINDVEYLDPYKIDSKVYNVYLKIKNPFDTSSISSEIFKELDKASKHAPTQIGYSADQWDKSNVTPIQWMNRLKDDIENGTTHAWTSIPDWVTNVLKNNGYDGIVDIGGKNGGEEHQVVIPFYSNQIKNIDNLNPTDNPDIRYSQNNKTWQSYLDKNYKNTGKGQTIQELKLTTANNNVAPSVANNMAETGEWTKQQSKQISNKNQFEKYNEYKKNILKSRANEVNNLISYKNETIRNIESKIVEKQELLNSKKNKDTKIAVTIRSQIERLKTQKTKIENLYNEKIDKINSKTNKEQIDFETRNSMKQIARETLREEISPLVEDLSIFKDKKAGWLYNRETAQRNIEDIVADKGKAKIINETIFNPVQKHQAERTREINTLYKVINDLELDKGKKYQYTPKETGQTIKIDEATIAQLLIEKKISQSDLKSVYNMTDMQIAKINKTADTFSGILDYLYDKMNEEQIKYGYSPIGKIKNYFPHFFENKPDTMLGKIASYFGIDVTKQNLPTEIAGKTDTFKPGKTWNSNTLERKTNRTDYDALKAMERYIQGATDIIYTTEDIQKIRAFEREIRYKYSEKGIQEEINKILNNRELTQEAKDASIEGIFRDKENELPNFVTWLNDYGNSLANKKSFSDRNMERNIGRNFYSSMSGIEARIASNTIGGNVSVSLTNFAPLFQAMGTTKVNYVFAGMLQTAENNITGIFNNGKDTSFVNNSTFLTNRFGVDSISKKTFSQKFSDKASILMNTIDEFTAESIVRAKYLENLDSGMVEEKALNSADEYAGKIMADRSKGALPLIFNSKNPLSKLITMFQVEPNNMVSNYFKDMPRDSTSKVDLTKKVTKLMIASYAFNTMAMAIRGGNEVLPDPIRWVSYLIQMITGDDDEKEKAKTDLIESVIGTTAFVSNLAGFIGIEDIGRVPISNAMPDLTKIISLFDKEADSQYKKETALKEFLKPFLYLGLPTGGAQIKKSVEGIFTIIKGGSYKTNKKGETQLQFPVENANALDYVKAGIFGKYSLNDSETYSNRGYKSLSGKQTKTYRESGIPFKEYTKYIDAKLSNNEEKIGYIENTKWSTEQKWEIYKSDILSNNERKDGGSQVSDAEYMIKNGTSKAEYINMYNKAKKNNIDMPTKEEYINLRESGVSLENYIDYNVNLKETTNELKKNGELTDTQTLKEKDKIAILINSNYSSKEKQGIYEACILSSNDKKYSIIKSTNMDITEYLQYKLADDNDELNSKQKAWNYIENMNITYTQKLLLYGLKYTPSDSQQQQIINYVKSLPNKTNKEKLEILSQFQGFTVYENGTVKY